MSQQDDQQASEAFVQPPDYVVGDEERQQLLAVDDAAGSPNETKRARGGEVSHEESAQPAIPAVPMKAANEINFADASDVKQQLQSYYEQIKASNRPLEDHPPDFQMTYLELRQKKKGFDDQLEKYITEMKGSEGFDESRVRRMITALHANNLSPDGHALIAASWQMREKTRREAADYKRKCDEMEAASLEAAKRERELQQRLNSMQQARAPAPQQQQRPSAPQQKQQTARTPPPDYVDLLNPDGRQVLRTEPVKTGYYSQFVQQDAKWAPKPTTGIVVPKDVGALFSFYNTSVERHMSDRMGQSEIRG